MDKNSELLLKRVGELENPRDILKAPELKQLYADIVKQPPEKRGEFGRAVNKLKQRLETEIEKLENARDGESIEPVDITAPCGINQPIPEFLTADNGSFHPLMSELERVVNIYQMMGFDAIESCQLDDDYHMFTSLNFPLGHPARDSYDAFHTEEGFIPPGHTSTMQNRILRANKRQLEECGYIASISYGRVFRNEDKDATHEHTFYQCEGIFVSRDATMGQMFGTLKHFFQAYYGEEIEIKTPPDYFPFTEPSAQLAIKRPGGDWLEMLGCGMIHPNVLKEAGIDPTKYRGFAWGGGVDRLAMIKYGINDLRLFESGKLRFLKEFK